MTGQAPPCPVCGERTLQRHCPDPHPTCGWDRCASCKSNIDRVTGRHDHPTVDNCKTCGPITRRRPYGAHS